MNKQVIIISALAVVLVGVGAAAYVATQASDDNKESSSTSKMDHSSYTFEPKATKNASFEGTFTVSNNKGTVTVGEIASDGKGNSKYSSTISGNKFVSYMVDDQYIMCTGETCLAITSDGNKEALKTSDYSYSEADYKDFKDKAEHKGRVTCGDETCDLWEINKGDLTTSFYINDKGQIAMLKGERADGTTYEMTYDYKDVTIVRPKNIQTINIPGQS